MDESPRHAVHHKVAVGDNTFVVGATILPFHSFVWRDQGYLFNVARAKAFKVPSGFALRSSAYRAAQVPIEAADFAVLDQCDLLANPSSDLAPFEEPRLEAFSEGVQTLVLNVIQACNLRCTYCFAGDGSYGEKGVMSGETAREAIDWYAAQHTNSFMEINFFGGEPLANFRLIEEAVAYGRSVALRCGKSVQFSITTNATLVTDRIATFLSDHAFRVAVSIDGPETVHNRNRPANLKRGSFDRAVAGLTLLRKAGVRPIARCTVAGGTDMFDVQKFFVDLGFEQVHVAKATLPQQQNDEAGLASVLSNVEIERDAVLEAEARGAMPINTVSKLADLIRSNVKQRRACGVGDKIAAVGIDGDLYACHRFTNDQKWKIGDIATGSSASRFFDKPVDQMSKCKSCWARYLCGGGCRHDNVSATGDPFTPPDEFCLEMKAYAEAAVIAVCEETSAIKFCGSFQ